MSSLSEYACYEVAWVPGYLVRLPGLLIPTMKVVKLFSEQPLAKRKETYDWYPNHNTYFALMGILHAFLASTGNDKKKKKSTKSNL